MQFPTPIFEWISVLRLKLYFSFVQRVAPPLLLDAGIAGVPGTRAELLVVVSFVICCGSQASMGIVEHIAATWLVLATSDQVRLAVFSVSFVYILGALRVHVVLAAPAIALTEMTAAILIP